MFSKMSAHLHLILPRQSIKTGRKLIHIDFEEYIIIFPNNQYYLVGYRLRFLGLFFDNKEK